MTPRVTQPPSKLPSFRRHRPAPVETAGVASGAFWDWVTLPPQPEGDAVESLPEEEYRVLSKAASGGGYMVPTDTAQMIVAASRAGGVLGALAQNFETGSGDTFNVPLAGTHGTAVWLAESGGYTPSDETITQQALGAFKAATKIIVSEELLADEAVELDRYLAGELGGRLAALQETAFAGGDGSGKPLGIVHASSPYTVVNAATGSSTAFKLADLVAVFKALPAAYRRTATWVINADDFASLCALADTAGGLVLPSLQFDPPSLFGRPVALSADLPAPAASAKSLAFGDWQKAYAVRRVKQISLQRQDELHSDSGQVGFKLYARSDGRPTLSDAARILAHSAT